MTIVLEFANRWFRLDGREETSVNDRRLVISANSGWYVAHFLETLIRQLKAAGYQPIIVAPNEVEIPEWAVGLGISWIPLHINRSGLNPFADFALLRQYRSVLRRLRPFAFLGFTIKPNIYGSLAAGSLGIPAIANVNGLGTAFIRGGVLERLVVGLYRAALRHARAVFFHNPDDRRLFIARKIVTGDCSRVVPGSGIDLDFFSFAPLPADPLRFLLVGRMLRDKGVREYVDAARSLRADFPQLRFQLLGGIDEGNRSAIPRAEIDAWVAEGLVDYLGRTSDVRPFLAASTIVVLPSYREGLPRTLLEAAAMGRPLLATNVPGCREVVEHGVNGIVCEARDSVSLAAAMKAYVRLPRPSLEAMGAASRHKVREQFGTECVVSAYLEVLDSMEPA